MVTCQEWTKKDYLNKFWNSVHLEKEKRKTSKFVDQEVTLGMREKGIWWVNYYRTDGSSILQDFLFKRHLLQANPMSCSEESLCVWTTYGEKNMFRVPPLTWDQRVRELPWRQNRTEQGRRTLKHTNTPFIQIAE